MRMRWIVGGLFVMAFAIIGGACADPKSEAFDSQSGDLAATLVQGSTYTSLVVEIDYVVGRERSVDVQERVMSQVLREILDKPGGVTFVGGPIPMDGRLVAENKIYSRDDLKEIEEAHRLAFNDTANGQASVYVLLLNGKYRTSDSTTLGVSYRGSSIALFVDTLVEECEPRVPEVCDMFDSTVLVHEWGHLLGLVNNGAPMLSPHQDAQHGHHDVNSECVMHFDQESLTPDVVRDRMSGSKASSLTAFYFDQECLDDLAALRDGR